MVAQNCFLRWWFDVWYHLCDICTFLSTHTCYYLTKNGIRSCMTENKVWEEYPGQSSVSKIWTQRAQKYLEQHFVWTYWRIWIFWNSSFELSSPTGRCTHTWLHLSLRYRPIAVTLCYVRLSLLLSYLHHCLRQNDELSMCKKVILATWLHGV